MADTVRVVRAPALPAQVRVVRSAVGVRVVRANDTPPTVRVSRQGPPGTATLPPLIDLGGPNDTSGA